MRTLSNIELGFPRASGDRPTHCNSTDYNQSVPPRERG